MAVTGIVQDWVSNPSGNLGLRMRANDDALDVRFVNKEDDPGRGAQYVPVLEVTYSTGGGDGTPPAVSATDAVLSGQVSDDSGPLSTITVGGTDVGVTGTDWVSGDVGLSANPENLPIVAEDASGNTTSITVSISR